MLKYKCNQQEDLIFNG